MARRELITCDKCGEEQGKHWDQSVSVISIKCPPDGVNGGKFSADLCAKCRRKLHSILIDFYNPEQEEN